MTDTIQIEITREQLLHAIKQLPEPDLHWLIEQAKPASATEHERTAEERRLQAWQKEHEYITQRIENDPPTEPQPRSWKREDLYDQ